MTQEELNRVLELNKKWLNNNGGQRADLSDADLNGADLCDANLSGATLSRANLCDADLSDADLRGANLLGAALSNADLRGANLSYANLCDANLSTADLSDADLNGADLCDANLSYVDLSDADLSDAYLWGANLSGADLSGAIGNMKQIKSLQIDEYPIVYTSDIIQIGCKNHSIEEWKNFDDETINKMDDGALEWWKKWKETLFKIIEMSPAEPTKDNK